jgi:hypothetical protein
MALVPRCSQIHIIWYHELARCITTMAGVVDPPTTTTFTKQLDRILIEMELINRRLDDHDNHITAMERNVSLLSLLVPSPPSAQLQPASPMVAETSEGEVFPIARCPALGTHANPCYSQLSRLSHPCARSNRDNLACDRYA